MMIRSSSSLHFCRMNKPSSLCVSSCKPSQSFSSSLGLFFGPSLLQGQYQHQLGKFKTSFSLFDLGKLQKCCLMKIQHQKMLLANSFLLVCMFSVSIFGIAGITRICKDAFLISGNVLHSTLKRSLMPFYLYDKSFLLSCTSKGEADKKYCV